MNAKVKKLALPPREKLRNLQDGDPRLLLRGGVNVAGRAVDEAVEAPFSPGGGGGNVPRVTRDGCITVVACGVTGTCPGGGVGGLG